VIERLILPALVFGTMAVEARRALANERVQRALGGVEPPGDVYAIMRLAYPGAFLAMFAEEALRGAPSAAAVLAGASLWAAAKGLKWWAILALGRCWTFRVIVVPGAPLIVSGPYRFMRHPNYVGVMGELAGVALMTGALVSGAAGTVAFGALVLRRIALEDQRLREAAR
jgi:methyltransferase